MKRREKLRGIYLGILFAIILFSFVYAAEPDTFLQIPNSAPEQILQIPNQSWPAGMNLTDAFDLDNYFEDQEEEFLNYTVSFAENITIIISENNTVSFIPDPLFIGTRIVTFNASDGFLETTSNLVYLEVGIDTLAPKWFNPKIDKTKVYQNNNVLFSTDWVDNFELMNYTVHVNQENIWTSYSGLLYGASNTSSHSVQISSPAGKIVQWKVCASDTSYNTNCTEIYEFDVLTTPVNPPSTAINDSSSSTTTPTGTTFYDSIKDLLTRVEEPDFSLNANSFLVSLKQGESKTRVLEIINIGNEPLNFTLSVEGVEDYVQLSEKVFEIFPGETKSITIDFKVGLNTEIGEYFGVLVVDSFKQARLPLAIVVNDVDLEFEVHVTILNKDKAAKPGKEINAKIDIKNLKDQILTEAVLQYSVKDFEGNIYNSNEENVSFDYSLSLERALEISENSPLGPYIFYARVFNEKASALNSAPFEVGLRFKFQAFLRTSFVFLLILILSFIAFFLVLRYRKQLNKGKVLNLYVKLNELKDLIKEEKFDEAANLYIGLKKRYGERVSQDILSDKSKLANEIKLISSKIDFRVVPVSTEKKEGEGKGEEEKKEGKESEEGKEPEEKPLEEKSLEEKSAEKKEEVKKEVETKIISVAKTPEKKVLPVKTVPQDVIPKVIPKVVPKVVGAPIVSPPKKVVVSSPTIKPLVKPLEVKKEIAKPVLNVEPNKIVPPVKNKIIEKEEVKK